MKHGVGDIRCPRAFHSQGQRIGRSGHESRNNWRRCRRVGVSDGPRGPGLCSRNHRPQSRSKRARGLVTDVQYGAVLSPAVEVREGDYADLKGASLVMITAGVNEKTGGATDRNDPAGRLRLLDTNVEVYKDIVRRLHAAEPQALVLVVTDPRCGDRVFIPSRARGADICQSD